MELRRCTELTWRTGRASRGFDCAATTELRAATFASTTALGSCPAEVVEIGGTLELGQSLAHVHRQYGRRGALPLRRGRCPYPGGAGRSASRVGEPVSRRPCSWLAAGRRPTRVFPLETTGTGKVRFRKTADGGMAGAGVRPWYSAIRHGELVRRMGGQVIRVGRGLDGSTRWTHRLSRPPIPMETRHGG